MTRFQMELSGKLGQFWQNEAQKELERVKSDLDSCKITIDADGVARNSIGRALADDMLEKVELVAPDCVNVSATRATYAAEVREALKGYASWQSNDVEMHEMRSAFGTGTTVVDVLTDGGMRYEKWWVGPVETLARRTGWSRLGRWPLRDVGRELQKFEAEAIKILKETGADHVLYGVKEYDSDGNLDTVRFYLEPMSEQEFEVAL